MSTKDIHSAAADPSVHFHSGDKIFRLSITISLVIHGAVLAGLFITNARFNRRIRDNLEIIYQAEIKNKDRSAEQPSHEVKSLLKESDKIEPKILAKKDAVIPPPDLKEAQKSLAAAGLGISEKKLISTPSQEGKRHISVPLLDAGKISDPRYLNYHEHIRTKIRNRAYLYIDSPEFKTGEVYLTFILLNDGTLKEVKIIDEKTTASSYLRSVGLRSIKESSPFPAFPQELKYPELTFNVVISFEVGE